MKWNCLGSEGKGVEVGMLKIKRVKKGKKLKLNVMIFCEGEIEEVYFRLIKWKYFVVNIKSKFKVKICRC